MDTIEMDVLVKHGARVVEDPDILDGTPVIQGTRIPAIVIAISHSSGVSIDHLCQDYPALTQDGLDAVMLWAKNGGGGKWLRSKHQ